MFLKAFLNRHKNYEFLFKFILSFSILYFFFPLYWGLTGEGGKFYISFLDHHLNVLKWLATFLTGAARLFLTGLGYAAYQKNYQILRIGSSPGVIVNHSCLGWGVMSFWVAFVYANSGTLRHKLKWITIGLAAIVFLNVFRISLIAVASHNGWASLTSLDHHQTFNLVSYCCIILLILIYLHWQKKLDKVNVTKN